MMMNLQEGNSQDDFGNDFQIPNFEHLVGLRLEAEGEFDSHPKTEIHSCSLPELRVLDSMLGVRRM